MADWSQAPTILIFGDSEEGLESAAAAARAHGGRIVARLPIADAVDRLDSQISVDLVLLDVSADHGAELDQLFRSIEEGVRSRRFASIVTIAPELVDITAARIVHEDVLVLVGRNEPIFVQAMASGISRTALELREGGLDNDERGRTPFLGGDGGISEDSNDVAYDDISAGIAALVGERIGRPDAAVIRGIIRARRLRNQFFGAGLFADPAWDILLDLMAAQLERRSVAVSSLCIAAAVPATTALRWIKQLTDDGLLRRVADPLDGRRVFIELTDDAVVSMTAYFTTLLRERPA